MKVCFRRGVITIGVITVFGVWLLTHFKLKSQMVEHEDESYFEGPNILSDPCVTPRRETGVEDLLCMQPPKFLKQYKNPCWMDNKTFRCLPYFHLIGNAKCGTTDFFRRINMHPEILHNTGYLLKETIYWSRNRLRLQTVNGKHVPKETFKKFTNYFRGPDIRVSPMRDGIHYKITGLGDPMDFYDRFDEENFPHNTPGAEELLWTTPYVIKHIQPSIKLLLILRDPIDRLYSHYFHGDFGNSSKSFHHHTVQSIRVLQDCLKNHTIRHCLYSKTVERKLKTPIYASFDIVHLREWMKVFPREQFMIFRNEDFSKDMRGHLNKVFEYLNVSQPNATILERMSSPEHYRKTISKIKAGHMLEETRNLLKTLFQPFVNDLAAFLKDNRYLFKDTNFG